MYRNWSYFDTSRKNFQQLSGYLSLHCEWNSVCVQKFVTGITQNLERSPDIYAWWRHQMETNIFRVTGLLCGEFTGEFPSQRPVTRSFDVFFGLRLNKRLSKQSWGWWFETPLCSLWRHRNEGRYLNKMAKWRSPRCRILSFVIILKICFICLKYVYWNWEKPAPKR